jgi:uncharacterized protein YecE (DUF72 family)
MIHLGTSGYVYRHWRDLFYPPGLPAKRWLDHYTRVFSTVELNATFYRLPTPAAVDGWREGTPRGFVFAAKGSRYLTHMKRLTDPGPGIDRYFELILRLRKKLQVVLWQLPPQMNRADPDRLARFLALLPRPRGLRHALEFRSDAWYTPEVCDVLDAHGAAFCEHDLVAARPPRLTGGFRYLRFHGATGKYRGRYGKRALRPFAASLKSFRGDAYVYFNNDTHGHAIEDALDLSALLDLPHVVRDEGRAAAAQVE